MPIFAALPPIIMSLLITFAVPALAPAARLTFARPR